MRTGADTALSGEEGVDQCGDLVGSLEMGDMAGPRDDPDVRLGDGNAERIRLADMEDTVLGAPDDEHRHIDVRERLSNVEPLRRSVEHPAGDCLNGRVHARLGKHPGMLRDASRRDERPVVEEELEDLA